MTFSNQLTLLVNKDDVWSIIYIASVAPSVIMEPRIQDYPHDQKTSKWCDKAFFSKFPHSSKFFFINPLETWCIEVYKGSVNNTKQKETNETFEWYEAPHEPQHYPQDLPTPVYHIQELVLIRPLRIACKCSI